MQSEKSLLCRNERGGHLKDRKARTNGETEVMHG